MQTMRQCLTSRILAAALLLLCLGQPVRADAVLLFAASSLKTALDQIAPGFLRDTGHRLTTSYAGSSALARQIQLGAPADVFISASADWMDLLETDGKIDPNSRVDVLGNTLVLIAHGTSSATIPITPDMDLADILGDGRLAMALVDAVPAGVYGKAALRALEQWDAVADKVAQSDNVRGALSLVASGEAPFGIVYLTDARAEPSVSVVGVFPAATHPPITYPAAIVAGRGTPATRALMAYLQSPEARAIFEAQGFVLPDTKP